MLDKPVHVILLPNKDYELAELLMNIGSITSGAIGIAKTTSNLALLIKSISFMRTEVKVLRALTEIIEGISFKLGPRQGVLIYDAMKNVNPLWFTSLTEIIKMFGGSVFTIMVVDSEFKNSVVFDSPVNQEYTVDIKGVTSPLRYWNGGHIMSNVWSSASPYLALFRNHIFLFGRHIDGNRIFCWYFDSGKFKPMNEGGVKDGWVPQDTSEGGGAVEFNGSLWICGRDPGGNQLFVRDITSGAFQWMGIDTRWKGHIAVWKGVLVAAAKAAVDDNIWMSLWMPPQAPMTGACGIKTDTHAALQVFNGNLYIIHTWKQEIFITQVIDISGSGSKTINIRLDEKINTKLKTSSGVASVVYKGKLCLFYRDAYGDAVLFSWSDDAREFSYYTEERYFGFDKIDGPATACVLPGESGIMLAGFYKGTQQIMWTVFSPEFIPRGKTPKRKSAKKAKSVGKKKTVAKKVKSKTAVKKGKTKPAVKKVKAKTINKKKKTLSSAKKIKRPTSKKSGANKKPIVKKKRR